MCVNFIFRRKCSGVEMGYVTSNSSKHPYTRIPITTSLPIEYCNEKRRESITAPRCNALTNF